MSFVYAVFALIVGAAVGGAIGYAVRQNLAKRNADSAEAKAELLIKQAESKLKEADAQSLALVVEGKKKALEMQEESKREDENRRKELRVIQQKLEKYDAEYQNRFRELQKKQEDLFERNAKVEALISETQKVKDEQVKKLEAVAQLSREEAKDILLKEMEATVAEEFESRLHKIERGGEEEYERKAKNIIALAMQRVATGHAVETTTTVVHLPSDEMKGRIIGKEGRNIKAVEQLTGCEIIVDDTPGAITISGFSPIRRQVCRIALENLIKDGRIQPAKIEDAVENAKKELAVDIKKAGEDALYELGIPVTSLDPKLVQILGRLKYRTSYGQNVLKHSTEVAHIAGMIAQELGADVSVCKKGGILHDIGKAVDHDVQGAHPEIGYNIMKKFGLPEEICYQSIGHHEDKPKTIEGIIVKVADAISGGRPGARKDTLELYIQRLEELEKTAHGFPGVEKVYAIQAGREVRVFVEPKQVDDFAAFRLAKDIAKKIESELTYPGEIRVNVIRETRVIEYAR